MELKVNRELKKVETETTITKTPEGEVKYPEITFISMSGKLKITSNKYIIHRKGCSTAGCCETVDAKFIFTDEELIELYMFLKDVVEDRKYA